MRGERRRREREKRENILTHTHTQFPTDQLKQDDAAILAQPGMGCSLTAASLGTQGSDVVHREDLDPQ